MKDSLELLKEIRKAPSFMGGSDRYKYAMGSDIVFNEDCDEVEKDLKALDKACQYIADSLEECPASKGLIDDLDCGNCNDDTAKCWKRYFKEVLRNE